MNQGFKILNFLKWKIFNDLNKPVLFVLQSIYYSIQLFYKKLEKKIQSSTQQQTKLKQATI